MKHKYELFSITSERINENHHAVSANINVSGDDRHEDQTQLKASIWRNQWRK
jgi:hypothetical protein